MVKSNSITMNGFIYARMNEIKNWNVENDLFSESTTQEAQLQVAEAWRKESE